jgi:hypothetical protein
MFSIDKARDGDVMTVATGKSIICSLYEGENVYS